MACALSTIAAVMQNDITLKQSASLLCHVAAASSSGGEEPHKSCGRYRRNGAIPPPQESVWGRLERNKSCDEMDFFMFVGLS